MPQNNKPGRRLLRQLYGSWYRVRHNISIFVRWCLFAVIIGVVVGVVGAAFEHALEWATETRQEYSWTLYFLPLVGVFIAFWYSKMDMPLERGTNFILTSVRQDHPVRLRLAPSIFITSVLTHLCGGSAGREGAALQLGGAISGNIGHLMHLDDKDSRTITMCGMAACFSALFGTPLTATIFAVEVVSVGVMQYAALLPCLMGALTGYGIAQVCGIAPTAFAVSGIPQLNFLSASQVILLSTLCAGLSILFCTSMHIAAKGYERCCKDRRLRAALGGAVVILLTVLLRTTDYNGAGMPIIEQAMAGQAVWYAFAAKLLLTALTLGAGFKGGEIVPTFFVGSTFGCVVAPLLGLEPSFGAAVGLIALFCGVVNCPVASFTLAVELFGGEGVIYFGIASVIGYVLSGYSGLYHGQKIVYSKLEPRRIDVHSR